jgi:hypothetical protein
MATYKVIQDIEAEDKLVGPFSLRQFIYAGIAVLLGYFSFICVSKHLTFMLVLFIPPMLFCMFFSWPWSPDQATEVWALAHIRFFFKPQKRIWDQSGVKDLVTITVPKRIEKTFTNGLSQVEVKSRLRALADTIDSRGWAVKNANVTEATLPVYDTTGSDRLVTSSSIPQPVSDVDVQASDDILDTQSNPVAHQFDQMIQASTVAHRQEVLQKMEAAGATPPQAVAPPTTGQPPADYWFLNQPTATSPIAPGNTTFVDARVVAPGIAQQATAPSAATPTADDEAVMQQALEQKRSLQQAQNSHLHTIDPAGSTAVQPQPATVAPPAAPVATPPVTPQSDAAILDLANNNDLNVATIARQANKAKESNEPPQDEVVISLH